MKNQSEKRFYLASVAAVFLLSFYPLQMGIRVLAAYIREGQVNAADYPKYVIPYTPIAIAVLVSVLLLPLVVKAFKRHATAAASVIGIGIFLVFELILEGVTVFSLAEGTADVGSWQAYLCVATPEVMQTLEYKETVGAALTRQYSPVFKIHFYLISVLMILAVIRVIYGFSHMIRKKSYELKRPLILQMLAVIAFIAMCILACFTSFYRTGELYLSTISCVLMSIFFILFGITSGVYVGSLLYGRRPVFSCLIPSIAASATTFVMYIGEMVMMDGKLFRFGRGEFFTSVGSCPFAPVDFAVIILSGVATCGLLRLIRVR